MEHYYLCEKADVSERRVPLAPARQAQEEFQPDLLARSRATRAW